MRPLTSLDPVEEGTPKPARNPKHPSTVLAAAHVTALWAIAIGQPLFDLLGRNPDFFVARGNTWAQVISFAALILLVPFPLVWLTESILRKLSERIWWGTQLALCAGISAVIFLRLLGGIDRFPDAIKVILALGAGIAVAWMYAKLRFPRALADFLTPAPLVVLVAFLLSGALPPMSAATDAEARQVEIGQPAPVIMLVFDEFPASTLMKEDGTLNRQRFPNFARLAAQGTWYRNTVAEASFTSLVVPTMLSGLEPDRSRLASATDYPDTIFTLLGGSYDMDVQEAITQLCPEELCESDDPGYLEGLGGLARDLRYVAAHLTLPPGIRSSIPDVTQSFEDFGETGEAEPAEDMSAAFAEAFGAAIDAFVGGNTIQALLDSDQPFTENSLHFAHVGVPHYPWNRFPDGMMYTTDENEFRPLFDMDQWLDDGYPTVRARQAQLLEVGYADTLLGRVFDQLDGAGKWNDALVVVAADHGMAMTKGLSRREATDATMGEIAMPPLFIKEPGQSAPRVVDQVTCLAEILPLVADALGVEVPWETAECDRDQITVINMEGPDVSLPAGEVLDQRDANIGLLASIFGQAGWNGVFRFGPGSGLVGREVGSLRTRDPGPGQAINPGDSLDSRTEVDLNSGVNPAFRQWGELTGIDPDETLAIVVNGRIAAVGQSYVQAGSSRYSVLVPPPAFRNGQNAVSYFRVADEGGTPVLEELKPAG